MKVNFVLVLNSGSSSVKYSLFKNEKCLSKGIKENIGLQGGEKNHKIAIKKILEKLISDKLIKDFSEIKIIGHRVVHGEEIFKKAVVLNKKNIKKLKEISYLAPLHNPANILGIEICQKLLPKSKNIAVFDTEFYNSLPESAYLYAIPYDFYQKHKIRKYGFHGISHKYICQLAEKNIGKKINRLITCHLGAGSSITAIKEGKPIDTSMGFTPLEGLVMESRSGSIDPSIPLFMISKLGYKATKVYDILNKQSGFLGICGLKDFRKILKKENRKTRLCYEIYLKSVVKHIGSYIALLGGIDAIVFTGGIGEGSAMFRKDVVSYFEFLGAKIDDKKNNQQEKIISTPDSRIKILTLPTNEELMIYREVIKLINKKQN